MLTRAQIIEGSSRLYPFYLLRSGSGLFLKFEAFTDANRFFHRSYCWTVPELVGVESQFSSLIEEIQELEVHFTPSDQKGGLFPQDYRNPCYEALFNFVRFQIQDQGSEISVKYEMIGCFVRFMFRIFEYDDDEDTIDECISDIRLFFSPQVSDGISVEEIVDKCIYEVWEYIKPVEVDEENECFY